MTDVNRGPGTGLGTPALSLVTADQKTIVGDGSKAGPLNVPAGAVEVAVDGISIGGNGTTAEELHTITGGTAVVADGESIVGNGLTGNPLAAVGGPTGAGNSDGVTLQGTGLLVNPYAIKAVQHDSTLTGNGSVASQLSVANAPAGSTAIATTGGTLSGNGQTGEPLAVVRAPAGSTAVSVDGATIGGNGQTGNALEVIEAPAGSTAVATDGGVTISGNGQTGTPLAVVKAPAGSTAVSADGTTIGGTGVFASPLAVLPAGLANQVAVLTDGVTTTGTGQTGNPIVSLASAGVSIYFNVKSYGATGNGVTDDSNAIRSAIAAAVAAGGGTVYFPDGTYVISQNGSSPSGGYCLLLSASVSLLGQSTTGTVLFLAANQHVAVRPIEITGTNLSISNLSINGNGGNQTEFPDAGLHRAGIFTQGASWITIQNVISENNSGDGINLFGETAFPTSNIYILNCQFINNQRTGMAPGGNNVQNVTIIGCTFTGNEQSQFEAEMDAVPPGLVNFLMDSCELTDTTDETLQISGGGIESTTIASGSNGQTLPFATIFAASTADFPTEGIIQVTTSTGIQTVSYTSITGGATPSFNGCAGGTGTMSTGNTITIECLCANITIRNTVINGSLFLSDDNGVLVENCTVTSVSAFPALKTSQTCFNITVRDSSFALGPASTAPQCVWLAGDSALSYGAEDYNFLDCSVSVQCPAADGVFLWGVNWGTIRGCTITGNESIEAAFYGVHVFCEFTATAKPFIRADIAHNNVFDFQTGLYVSGTGASSSGYTIEELDVTDNYFGSSATAGLMTTAISLDGDGHHCALNVTCYGNSAPGVATLIGTYPHTPMLIGGNRGAGGIYSCAGSPSGVINDTQGSVAYQRDASTDSTVGWINFGGGTAGWHSVNVT